MEEEERRSGKNNLSEERVKQKVISLRHTRIGETSKLYRVRIFPKSVEFPFF